MLLLAPDRVAAPVRNAIPTGGGGSGAGPGQFRKYGDGGRYDRALQESSSILGPQQKLLTEFKRVTGVRDPFNPSRLIDEKTAGIAYQFGETEVPRYLKNAEQFNEGAIKSINGDVKLKEGSIKVAKAHITAMAEQHGLDVDLGKHAMNATVAIAAQRADLDRHLRFCEGRIQVLGQEAGGMF